MTKVSGRTAAAIAASFEQQLHAGKRGTGEALPTVRGLAATLDVSPATVAAAYKLLRARGLVAGRGRRGTRVAAGRITPAHASFQPVPDGAVDLASGNPDPALLPLVGPALRAIEDEVRLYGERADRGGLTAFASAEFQADGIPARAVTVLSGAMDAIERVLREHLRPGDGVALEDPSFPGVLDLVAASGYAAMPFGLDQEGPLPDALHAAIAKGCRAIIVTPRAQNPTGAALSAGRAAELKRALRRFPDVLLIENDYAAPVAGAAFRTLYEDSRNRWAVIRSTSKFLGPDLRVALMAGDDLTISRVRGRHALGARWVSHILQQLTLALWSDPSSGRLLARAGAIYTQRRAAALAALRERGIEASAASGFNIWIPVRDEAQVVQAMAECGWVVAAGQRFRIRSVPGVRLTISTLQPAEAGRLAGDLASALRARSAASA
jgi:DNA-binding transcriptional MocR family regulator